MFYKPPVCGLSRLRRWRGFLPPQPFLSPPPIPSTVFLRTSSNARGSLPLVLSLSSIFRIIIFSFSHPPAVSANNRTSFRPVYTCNARGHRPLSHSCRARTITVIYCITGAWLYGPLIAARVSDRRCVSKSVENRILYRQLPPHREPPAAIVPSRLHRDTTYAIAL